MLKGALLIDNTPRQNTQKIIYSIVFIDVKSRISFYVILILGGNAFNIDEV